ncbi:unnamed protein product [Schistosoma spindalis]|nr:unnamed protein product [Schistosoma spindale]
MNRWYIFECERLKQLHLPLTRLQVQHFHQINQMEQQVDVKKNNHSKYIWNTCPVHNSDKRNSIQPFTTLTIPIGSKCNCMNHDNLWCEKHNKLQPVNLSCWYKPDFNVPTASLRQKAYEDYQQYRLQNMNRTTRTMETKRSLKRIEH